MKKARHTDDTLASSYQAQNNRYCIHFMAICVRVCVFKSNA